MSVASFACSEILAYAIDYASIELAMFNFPMISVAVLNPALTGLVVSVVHCIYIHSVLRALNCRRTGLVASYCSLKLVVPSMTSHNTYLDEIYMNCRRMDLFKADSSDHDKTIPETLNRNNRHTKFAPELLLQLFPSFY